MSDQYQAFYTEYVALQRKRNEVIKAREIWIEEQTAYMYQGLEKLKEDERRRMTESAGELAARYGLTSEDIARADKEMRSTLTVVALYGIIEE